MKNLFRLSIGMLVALAFASCQDLGELKPQYFTVNPNPLEVKGGKVEGTITATFPEKYFAEKGVVEVTPVLKYEGGEALAESKTYQGTKVEGNNETVQYKAGGTVSQNFAFDYVPAMRNSKLALRFKATLKDKEVQIPEIEIALGCIATETLADASEIAPAFAKDNFQRETFEVTEADIMFQIQQSNVKANDAVKNLNAVAKATLKDSLRNVESLTLVSAASPDGGVKLNDKLAAAREKNTVKYMKNKNQAAIDAKYIAQDWEGFQALVNASEIQDKELILRVLSQYQDPAQREAEIKNLSAAYKELANDILPKLRRSHLTLTVKVTGKTDEEIIALAKSNPDTLNVEELMFAATIAENAEDAAQFIASAAEIYAADWRTVNNLGAQELAGDNYANATATLEKAAAATEAEQSEINFNNALLSMINNDYAKAEELLGKSAGVAQLGEAQGIVSITKGNYAQAVSDFGLSTSNNAALAQLLSGNTDRAASIIENIANKNAKSYYIAAICAARSGDAAGVTANLAKVKELDEEMAKSALTDLEFAKFLAAEVASAE